VVQKNFSKEAILVSVETGFLFSNPGHQNNTRNSLTPQICLVLRSYPLLRVMFDADYKPFVILSLYLIRLSLQRVPRDTGVYSADRAIRKIENPHISRILDVVDNPLSLKSLLKYTYMTTSVQYQYRFFRLNRK